MLASSVSTDRMEEQAARWAARALDGEMPADMASAFEAWMSADRRHRGAYLRARAILYTLEDAVVNAAADGHAPNTIDDDVAPDARMPLRVWFARRRAALGGALAASLVVAAGLGFAGLLRSPSQPPPAQVAARDLTLADGSVATLGEGAKLEFTMRDGVRKVRLLRGEALFHVAKDRAHPFVIQSGDVYAQATGTVYSVRRIGETGGAVRVQEGSVLVWGRDDREQAVLLHAGGALTLEPGLPRPDTDVARVVRPSPPPPALAQIALDDVTIAAAAERFNRINRTRIVVDPAVGQIRIVGLFRANDPERFAQAAAAVAGGETEIGNGTIVIKPK